MLAVNAWLAWLTINWANAGLCFCTVPATIWAPWTLPRIVATAVGGSGDGQTILSMLLA